MIAGALSVLEALLLGLVEGVTEFLPVSSTGHLLVVGELIGFGGASSSPAADAYAVVIQFGAILAVVLLYRARLWSMVRGIAGHDDDGRLVLRSLVLAFVPAAVAGVVFGDTVKDALFGPVPVALAWAAGGIVLLVRTPRGGSGTLQSLGAQSAVTIGVAQCIALWPGVSRSLVTLLAGLAVGLSLAAAVEFSFLLGLVTLSAATCLDLVRHGDDIAREFGVATPLVGAFAAFVTAVVAVRWMVSYLSSRSLAVFGWYRICAAAAAGILLATGVL